MEEKNNSSSDDEGPLGKMEDWSVEQVCQWLTDLKRDPEVIAEFQRHKISGFVLSKLEEKHFERMQCVMIGDQVTILNKRNEVLQKEQVLEASPKDFITSISQKEEIQPAKSRFEAENFLPQHGVGASNFLFETKSVFTNLAAETKQPQTEIKNQDFAQVIKNQNYSNQVCTSSPDQIEEAELNSLIVLPTISKAPCQTQTPSHEAEEVKQTRRDSEERKITNTLTSDSENFEIPVVSYAAEVMSGNGDSVDMSSDITDIRTSDTIENVLLSGSKINDQFQDSCEERSLGLQGHISKSSRAPVLENSGSVSLISVNNDFAMEKTLSEQQLQLPVSDTELPKSLVSEPMSALTMPAGGEMLLKFDETSTARNSGELVLTESVEIEHLADLKCQEHAAEFAEISESSKRALAEAGSEQSIQKPSRSGIEFTSRLASASSEGNEKMSQFEHVASLSKGIQMAAEEVGDKENTETHHEVSDILKSKVIDMKQINIISDYSPFIETNQVDENVKLVEEQNLCTSESDGSNVHNRKTTCELERTLPDSDTMSKDDEKVSEFDQKQSSESIAHAVQTVPGACPESIAHAVQTVPGACPESIAHAVQTVPDACPESTLVSSEETAKGPPRRHRNVQELLEYKKQKLQNQSAQCQLNPSSSFKPSPTAAEKHFVIPHVSEKSRHGVHNTQMFLTKDENALLQSTQKNQNPVLEQDKQNITSTDLFKDLSLEIKALNCPSLADVEKKQSANEMQVNCTPAKVESTVKPERCIESIEGDSRKSVEPIDSSKIEPQVVGPHCSEAKFMQSTDIVPLSMVAGASTLKQEPMEPECTNRPVSVQNSSSTAKKKPFSNEKSPMNMSNSFSQTSFPSQLVPLSAAESLPKKSSVKLIGKKIPQNESKAKFLRNTLTEREIVKVDQLPAEVLRKIGSQVDITFKYRQGAKISTSEGYPGKNLLYPVHRFAVIESLKDVTSVAKFSKEVIQFACACLNERTNGIIHFGIEQESRNSVAIYGKIVGVALYRDTKEYGDLLRKAIRKCFKETQAEAASNCIIGPQFIETVPNKISQIPQLFVIEVDVIPKQRFCQEEVFYVKLPTEEKGCFEPEAMFQIIDGVPHRLDTGDDSQFRMKVALLAAERKDLEDQLKMKQRIENDLSKKFIHLFCHGSENLLGDHYHILVLNKPEGHMDREYMAKTLSFIAEIEWKVVFDFDAEASLCNFVQEQDKLIKIKMTDDFYHRSKYNIQDPDRLKQILDDLKNSDCPTWVFANGYQPQNEESQPPREWKKNRSEGFKHAVRFFGEQIPQGRATVLFLLLSKETEVMLLAADELMTIFYDQWMCVAENEEIGKPWIEELVRRDSAEPEAAESNVVWGMPWKHVQLTVSRVLGPKKYSVCELPTSTGAYIPVNNNMSNELTDLDILGSFECDNAEIQYDEEQLRQHKKKVEEEFYKGNCVSWWNYWFHQVCVRDILDSSKKNVLSALNYDEDAVGKVFLYHQPGAGATTLAKNILWDFRKDYRCAVVRKITGGQTAGQVLKLFSFEDKDPKPILVLLDNPDADKLNLLYADLCEMARYLVKNNDEIQKVVCVLLVCSRLGTKAGEFDPKRLFLKHELSPRELNWFKDRYKDLTAEFVNGTSDIRPPNAVHPRLLISFNVMKENFNPEYIRRTVRELVHTVTDPKEQTLLKYVSLLNSFDLECRPIPTSSLDGMMLEIPWLNQGGLRYGLKAKSNRWETKLSAEVRVLLNETSETALGKIHSLRIANPLLSREILYVLRNNGSVPVGDITLEFLRNKEIFKSLCLPRDNLVNIIKDVLKRRQQKGGKPETAFSPLIQHIVDHESFETAVDVMKEVLALTSDPYIDQQLARLYIRAQNWQMATEFAKKATDQRPENSFFWDTYGRIYERQLVEEYEKLAKDTVQHSVNDLVHVIKIALDGMQMFRKVQETSEQEKTTIQVNKAGFFGELQLVVCLLDCLTYVFRSKEELRAFILTEIVPTECWMLEDIDGRNYLEELKTLEKHVQQAMNRLEDELVQLRDDTLYEYQRTKYSKYEIDSLQRLKENLDNYFGEEGDTAPGNLSEKDQCDFRRRRVFRLASHNIGSIFDLRWKPEGEENLVRIRKIALQNLQTSFANAEDYLVIICVNLAMTSMAVSSLYDIGIKFDDMVEWSTRLYKLRETSIVIHLEPYLFYVMFNWPRRNTKHSVVPKLLENALRQWKDAYYTKYPRQKDEGKPYRKKDTTMFFLANGSDMASIYTTFEERGSRRINENKGRNSFWKLPDTLRKLQRFEGVLSRDGNEVSVHLQYSQGNKALITIPTSLPIQNRNMWNKKVYFVIGFSWNGPRAFDVSLHDPTLEADMARDHRQSRNVGCNISFASSRRPGQIHDFTQEDFSRKLSEIMTKLQNILKMEDKLKSCAHTQQKLDEIESLEKSRRKLEKDRNRLLQERKRGMESRIPDFTVFTAY